MPRLICEEERQNATTQNSTQIGKEKTMTPPKITKSKWLLLTLFILCTFATASLAQETPITPPSDDPSWSELAQRSSIAGNKSLLDGILLQEPFQLKMNAPSAN